MGSETGEAYKEENEKKKKYLSRYQKSLKLQKELEEEIEQLRADRMFPERKQGSAVRGSSISDLSGYAAQIDELIRELRQQVQQGIEIRKKISRIINELDDETEILIMRMRYIHGKKWEEIEKETGYEMRHVYRVHGNALRKIKIN